MQYNEAFLIVSKANRCPRKTFRLFFLFFLFFFFSSSSFSPSFFSARATHLTTRLALSFARLQLGVGCRHFLFHFPPTRFARFASSRRRRLKVVLHVTRLPLKRVQTIADSRKQEICSCPVLPFFFLFFILFAAKAVSGSR